MSEQEFKAFIEAFESVPSQDNEGYRPDRGSYKRGWFDALKWVNENDQKEKFESHTKIKKYVEQVTSLLFKISELEKEHRKFKKEWLK